MTCAGDELGRARSGRAQGRERRSAHQGRLGAAGGLEPDRGDEGVELRPR